MTAADTDAVDQAGQAPAAEPGGAGRADGADRSCEGGGAGRRIGFLAALAAMVMLCEGAANDWSILRLKDVLGASASTVAFAYGTFAATMARGRLLTDRLAARWGPWRS
ncbi:hypothetical protein ACIQVT_01845 [Streptomyces sp. NPDC100445]|uniref:hypothetical protein n=1 Tax=Streptomyces sp. NPDC100445 TaxID=3366102 RepID=UPI003821420A